MSLSYNKKLRNLFYFQKFDRLNMYMKGVNYMSDNSTEKLLNRDEQFYTAFEPKTTSRFLCELKKRDKTQVLPSYIINSITRPSVTRKDGQWQWNPIKITTYDPIVPSAAQMFYEYLMEDKPEKFDIIIDVLGPVGDSVEKWEIKNAEFINIDFGTLNWCDYAPDNKSEIHGVNLVRYYHGSISMEIEATIGYEVAELLY